ncbi:glycoside hydrolase superfamily [Paecilomyces variotii]|uniref:glucan 1,3-beta-glucosidase n=1 Tax=Byssochlamys spectabilis TaxID=264951 RepID=A0A443HV76_BYSSP|nr:glycoside hydrolase superfamily [Paecilomyces variotii]KAJ9291088.1 CAZyme family GH17 [Paecilomyces variotii]KAJ9322437.1 CAZyme family GH17 [Paecilomyces variotii]KAJ9337924.1 CAZyme family GH17 [Paecilomyces variotii]KAJ9356050.1 CAZyme family GH17 [Paecilomyces variotii]RWQ95735.1 glycoside hydrolase superfamily [Paecilomyces variotii]
MRISNILPIALAAAPVAVSAAGTLGLALGDKNPDGSCKQTSDYEADFDQLKSVTKLVRTYSASDCNTAKNIIPAAKAKGFKVVLGVWPDYDQSFKQDTDALQATVPGNEDVVEAITVGSETLYRGTFTGQQLLDRINKVKAMFPTVKIGTADSWNKFVDGTADPLITGGVEYILTNAFAYWQGQPAEDAHKTYFDDMAQTINHIQKLAGENANKIQIITGETGWPTTGGSNYGQAIAGTENAETFFQKGVCGMLAWGVDVFYFEAYDEPWKPKSVGDDGSSADETHWGMFTAERQTKFNTTC